MWWIVRGGGQSDGRGWRPLRENPVARGCTRVCSLSPVHRSDYVLVWDIPLQPSVSSVSAFTASALTASAFVQDPFFCVTLAVAKCPLGCTVAFRKFIRV